MINVFRSKDIDDFLAEAKRHSFEVTLSLRKARAHVPGGETKALGHIEAILDESRHLHDRIENFQDTIDPPGSVARALR